MATLFRKFGLSSPSRTPSFVHWSHHRRMTLGTLLLSPIESNRKHQQQQPRQSSLMRYLINNDQPVIIGKNTLMDLLLSSTNPFDVVEEGEDDHEQILSRKTRNQEKTQSLSRSPIKGSNKLRNGGNRKGRRGMKMSIGKAAFTTSPGVRFRFLLKRSWRPMLIAIPEGELIEHY